MTPCVDPLLKESNLVATPAIEAVDLTKHFDDVVAVIDLNFAIAAGSMTALLGGNGAGKTTTIGMLLGLLIPTAGTARLNGHDMRRHRYRVLPSINFSSPYFDLPKRLTVRENLLVFAQLYCVEQPEARVGELAEALGLTGLLNRATGQLSAGQKTRVALAKSLINEPEILFLDEPTASLDPDSADWIRGWLERYRARTNATILLASHNMLEVERLADDVLMLKDGRLVDRGAPEALIARYGRATMEEVFLDIARDLRRHPDALTPAP
jgi:ABC-2 type transport system ATP-binding protein